jgi:hypothetical protein
MFWDTSERIDKKATPGERDGKAGSLYVLPIVTFCGNYYHRGSIKTIPAKSFYPDVY